MYRPPSQQPSECNECASECSRSTLVPRFGPYSIAHGAWYGCICVVATTTQLSEKYPENLHFPGTTIWRSRGILAFSWNIWRSRGILARLHHSCHFQPQIALAGDSIAETHKSQNVAKNIQIPTLCEGSDRIGHWRAIRSGSINSRIVGPSPPSASASSI